MIDELIPEMRATVLGVYLDGVNSEHSSNNPATLRQALVQAQKMIEAGHEIILLQAGDSMFSHNEVKDHLGL